MRTATDEALALLEAHGNQLFALLFRLTLRHDVADDLLQDLFCKLAARDGFRRADNRLAYAHRMATNLAFDWRRRQRLRAVADNCRFVDAGAAAHSPLADLVRREELEQILNAIGELSPAAREIIVLRYLNEQSYGQIAKQLGKTMHQVRALAHKALVRLRKTMNSRPRKLETNQPISIRTPSKSGEPA